METPAKQLNLRLLSNKESKKHAFNVPLRNKRRKKETLYEYLWKVKQD